MRRLIGYDVDFASIPKNETRGIAAHEVPQVRITGKQVSRYLSAVLAYRDHDVIIGSGEDNDSKHFCLRIYHGTMGEFIHIPPMLHLYTAEQLKLLEGMSKGQLPYKSLAEVQLVMKFLSEENSLQRTQPVCSLEMRLRNVLAPPSQKPL